MHCLLNQYGIGCCGEFIAQGRLQATVGLVSYGKTADLQARKQIFVELAGKGREVDTCMHGNFKSCERMNVNRPFDS